MRRIFDLLHNEVAAHNKPDALAYKVHGEWVKFSAQDFINTANKISIGLKKLGIGKDDKVAIISPNRPEWNMVDLGIQQLGAVSVPMYPTITVDDYRYIFNDSGAKIIFVADELLLNKAREAASTLPQVQEIYTFDRILGGKHWSEVSDLARGEDVAQLEPLKAAVSSDDLLTLIYTSGTTGVPKGVMLTHSNVMSNLESTGQYLKFSDTFKVLSFLPLCHIYERVVVYMYFKQGASIYYAESMETISANLQEVKPNAFTTVPRLLEKVYDKIVAKGYELTGIKKKLFFWAMDVGMRYDNTKDQGWWYNKKLGIARKLIFSKWKAALGGNIEFITSGASALQPRLARIFAAAEIPVLEGYGLTETSPVITMSVKEDYRFGCVGIVVPGVTVKIAEDGEILCKGPNVMKGYYNKPEATAEAIDTDGWFHTGDIGTFVDGKYLKITDRKKEIFKTSGGKYVAPQMVENKLKESVFIEQVCVVGENQKFPGALVIPSFDALKTWCAGEGIAYSTDAEMVKNATVIKKVEDEVAALNTNFAQYEQVKKIALLPALFSIDAGEVTPTLKLKRKNIHAKYANIIDGFYA